METSSTQMVDGSCCVTLRNRWFLKNINPVMINDNMTTMWLSTPTPTTWMMDRDTLMASPAPWGTPIPQSQLLHHEESEHQLQGEGWPAQNQLQMMGDLIYKK